MNRDESPQGYREAKEGSTEWLYADAFPETYEGVGSPSEAAAKQVGGNHYSKHTIQPWHIVDEYGLDHYRATALKYLLRNKMDVREDIEKAIHCLEHWLEISPNA